MRQTPLTCSGHTRPVVDLAFSGITPYGYFLISACKGESSGVPWEVFLPIALAALGRTSGWCRTLLMAFKIWVAVKRRLACHA